MAVYFARAETTSLVKIGFASNAGKRMALLQAGCPYRLTLVREVEGDRRMEGAFHWLFSEHRLERDWFRWTPIMATAEAPERERVVVPLVLREHLKSERGRLTKLANALDVFPSAISQWDKVPAERVIAVEEATGISRYDLRPDLFGPKPEQGEAA